MVAYPLEIQMNYDPGLDKPKRFRELVKDRLENANEFNLSEENQLDDELLKKLRPELRNLWQQHLSAQYIGVRYDQRKFIVGTNLSDMADLAERLYGLENPLFDYISDRRLMIGISTTIIR